MLADHINWPAVSSIGVVHEMCSFFNKICIFLSYVNCFICNWYSTQESLSIILWCLREIFYMNVRNGIIILTAIACLRSFFWKLLKSTKPASKSEGTRSTSKKKSLNSLEISEISRSFLAVKQQHKKRHLCSHRLRYFRSYWTVCTVPFTQCRPCLSNVKYTISIAIISMIKTQMTVLSKRLLIGTVVPTKSNLLMKITPKVRYTASIQRDTEIILIIFFFWKMLFNLIITSLEIDQHWQMSTCLDI